MRDPKTGRFISKVEKVKKKKKNRPPSLIHCSKQDLLRRIEEVMTRIWGKIPNDVITSNWDWDRFKAWITTPFLYLDYEEYDDSREI